MARLLKKTSMAGQHHPLHQCEHSIQAGWLQISHYLNCIKFRTGWKLLGAEEEEDCTLEEVGLIAFGFCYLIQAWNLTQIPISGWAIYNFNFKKNPIIGGGDLRLYQGRPPTSGARPKSKPDDGGCYVSSNDPGKSLTVRPSPRKPNKFSHRVKLAIESAVLTLHSVITLGF